MGYNLFIMETSLGYAGGIYSCGPLKPVYAFSFESKDGKEVKRKRKTASVPWLEQHGPNPVDVSFKEEGDEFIFQRAEWYKVSCYWSDVAVDELERANVSIGKEAAKKRCLEELLEHHPWRYDGPVLQPYEKRYLLSLGKNNWVEF